MRLADLPAELLLGSGSGDLHYPAQAQKRPRPRSRQQGRGWRGLIDGAAYGPPGGRRRGRRVVDVAGNGLLGPGEGVCGQSFYTSTAVT